MIFVVVVAMAVVSDIDTLCWQWDLCEFFDLKFKKF